MDLSLTCQRGEGSNHAGRLSGLEGILAKVKNKDFLEVSVSILRRSIAVEIEKNSVELSDITGI